MERSGILPYCSVFSGDHKPCFLDFNASLLFAGSTTPLAPVCQHSLQLSDPRKIAKYKSALHEQLEYHKVMDKCKNLHEIAAKGMWEDAQTKQYENLDLLITESMLFAERACSKRYSKQCEWSPALVQSLESVRYWRLLLKHSKGLPIKQSSIQRARTNAGLLDDWGSEDLPTISGNFGRLYLL